jgi:hypothetical protein
VTVRAPGPTAPGVTAPTSKSAPHGAVPAAAAHGPGAPAASPSAPTPRVSVPSPPMSSPRVNASSPPVSAPEVSVPSAPVSALGVTVPSPAVSEPRVDVPPPATASASSLPAPLAAAVTAPIQQTAVHATSPVFVTVTSAVKNVQQITGSAVHVASSTARDTASPALGEVKVASHAIRHSVSSVLRRPPLQTQALSTKSDHSTAIIVTRPGRIPGQALHRPGSEATRALPREPLDVASSEPVRASRTLLNTPLGSTGSDRPAASTEQAHAAAVTFSSTYPTLRSGHRARQARTPQPLQYRLSPPDIVVSVTRRTPGRPMVSVVHARIWRHTVGDRNHLATRPRQGHVPHIASESGAYRDLPALTSIAAVVHQLRVKATAPPQQVRTLSRDPVGLPDGSYPVLPPQGAPSVPAAPAAICCINSLLTSTVSSLLRLARRPTPVNFAPAFLAPPG